MKITIHRGINQTGGCITEIATASTHILIDLGQNLYDSAYVVNDGFADEYAIKLLTHNVVTVFSALFHGKIAPNVRRKLENIETYAANNPVKTGNIKVTPLFDSHSDCAAHMFLIETTGGKRVLYTGDFRGEGRLSEATVDILKNCALKKPVDILIMGEQISPDSLADVCNLVNPATAIIPANSQQAQQFKNLHVTEAIKEKIVTTSLVGWKFNIIIHEHHGKMDISNVLKNTFETPDISAASSIVSEISFQKFLAQAGNDDFEPVEIIGNTNENIFLAVETGDVEKIREALTEERINAATYYGYKSIMLAVENANIDVLKVLLDNATNVRSESFWSNRYKLAHNALFHASCNVKIDVVKLLLEYGANAVIKDMDDALYGAAVWMNNIELLNILLEAGAKFQYPLILAAVEKGNIDIAEILLKRRSSKLPKKQLTQSFTNALLKGNLEIVKFLLKLGADVNIKDDESGYTPLIFAVLFPSENKELLIETLLAAGADVNEKDKKGVSAMQYAVKNKEIAIVELLKKTEKTNK